MITRIELRRFKRFHALSLRASPLTVLTGTNGAGKSSVLHALLLARQAALAPTRDYLELNGVDALQLGGALDVIHRPYDDDTASIEISEEATARWVLSVPDDERSRTASLSAKPDGYRGVLAQPAPAFAYLSAERYGPRDVLPASAVDVTHLGVGVHGEFTAQVLAICDHHHVPDARWAHDPEGSRPGTLLHQTEAWMHEFVRPLQIRATWFQGTSVTRLEFKTPGVLSEWTRPPNMGFGVSYTLPVVVAALRASVGGLLIVENPEAHLHPAGQSGMGAFLARVASDGVQVILETHSDHVLNGIRKAVADGRAPLNPSDVAIHFFRGEDDGGDIVETMELRHTGQLSYWPAGFFDQTQRDLAEIARAQRKKPR